MFTMINALVDMLDWTIVTFLNLDVIWPHLAKAFLVCRILRLDVLDVDRFDTDDRCWRFICLIFLLCSNNITKVGLIIVLRDY